MTCTLKKKGKKLAVLFSSFFLRHDPQHNTHEHNTCGHSTYGHNTGAGSSLSKKKEKKRHGKVQYEAYGKRDTARARIHIGFLSIASTTPWPPIFSRKKWILCQLNFQLTLARLITCTNLGSSTLVYT